MDRAIGGNKVSLGGTRDPSALNPGQADIIDHTAGEAIQMKTITSPDPAKLPEHTQKAVDQLGGSGGEVPPEGFQRIAEIRIQGTDNPMARADRDGVLDGLKGEIDRLENLEPPGAEPGFVRVINTRGTFEFFASELR